MALLVVTSAGTQGLGQVPQKATAHAVPAGGGLYRIAGTVVNAESGEPLRRAAVAILSEEDSHTVAAVESDSEGRFAFEGLAAAKYQLTASKRGFRTEYYDEHDEYSSAIVTGPNLDTGSITFRLTPGAVLHGVVTTDGGDPVENARVMLFLKSHNGKAGGRLGQVDSASTDDTGAYEFSGLQAGDYQFAVVAEPWYAMHPHSARGRAGAGLAVSEGAAALDVVYPITYFDSTTEEASATHIALAGGGRMEANVTLHATQALRIEVQTPVERDGRIARAELRQMVFGTMIGAESAGFLDSMQSGVTEFNGVAPGHYELAQGDPPRVVDLDATSNLLVDASVGTATVQVSGTVRDAKGGSLADDCSLVLSPLAGTHRESPMPAVCRRGAFAFPSVPSGRWQLSGEGGGKQLAIGSITTGSGTTGGHTQAGNLVTVEDQPVSLVVNLSAGTTRLTGFATRDGKGLAGVMVVLVPRQLAAIDSLVRRDQSDSDGSFALRDVTPGDYTVVAIEDGWTLDWAEPSVIGRYLPGGVAVTVSANAGKEAPLPRAVAVQAR